MPEIVVITGGTAGVGRAVARRFARAGAKIAVLARGVEGLRATAIELVTQGASAAISIPCDVSNAGQVNAAAARVEHELGPIDIWINNAMTTLFGRVEDMHPDEFRRITDVTYHGYVWGTRAALKHMRARNRGVIVQVGSFQAYRAMPLQSAYAGAKHAIRGFTDALRSELEHDKCGVALTMVQLPSINTPQFSWCANRMSFAPMPVPPIYTPESAAETIYEAAHHPRREVLVGWPTVKAVLGSKLIPGFIERMLAKTGFDRQHALAPAEPYRAENLFHPVPGDVGTRGDFELRSRALVVPRTSSWLGTLGVQTAAVTVAAALVVGVAGLLRLATR